MVEPIFRVIVDYGKSLKEIIVARKYDYVDPNITEKNFPTKGSGKSEVEVELVHYNKRMTSEEALADFKTRDLKPGPIEVLCAVGRERPEFQREFLIVALGSAWQDLDGGRYVPCLWDGLGVRCLRLRRFERDWDENCRFLAIPEV
jgi:hypothetical protein